MSDISLEIVAAVAKNGVIGRGGQLPWHLPDDLRYFKAVTMGYPTIMGRRTFEEIKQPLPGRRCIVVSRTLDAPPHPNVELVRSLDDAEELLNDSAERAFVVGGGILFQAALPRVRVMHLTELEEPVEGDAFFPPFDRSEWRVVRETPHARDDKHAIAFTIRVYERI